MFEIEELELPEIKLLRPKIFKDSRGLFYELYKTSDYEKYGFPLFVQDNLSISNKGVLRGLHYQKEPFSQGKLLTVLKGKVLDLVVDIRPQSKSFLEKVSIELSAENHYSLYIPPGFAHGFLSLNSATLVMYKTTKEYSPKHESGIIWNDPDINFKWPIDNPVISDKDNKLPRLRKVYE